MQNTHKYGIAGDGREYCANPDPRTNPEVAEQIRKSCESVTDTGNASRETGRIIPGQLDIALRALFYARNVTTSQDVYSQLSAIITATNSLKKQIGG